MSEAPSMLDSNNSSGQNETLYYSIIILTLYPVESLTTVLGIPSLYTLGVELLGGLENDLKSCCFIILKK